jgi:hypothetical protein
MLFRLNTVALLVLLAAIAGAATLVGHLLGRRIRARPDYDEEPVGVVQGTLLGLIGLLLAFGLTMGVSRYENRRSVMVQEANAIGTTYLRAQMLSEPERTTSLDLLETYADAAVRLARRVPFQEAFDEDAATMESIQRDLWAAAGDAVQVDPEGTAPRLYIDSLNDTFDRHGDRVASLRNRVPPSVLTLLVAGSAVALGVLALYLALIGRGITTALVAAGLLVLIQFVTFDLDRPQRGLIKVPATPLEEVRASMDLPPAAGP